MRDSRWWWHGGLLLLVGACAGAPLDQHLLQEILDQQDRRDAADPRLRQRLGYPNPMVRAWAARALGAVGATDALAALAHTLHTDADAEVRRWAAFALGSIPGPTNALREALHADTDPATRAIAAWGLGRQGGTPADLEPGLADPHPDVRVASATAVALARHDDMERRLLNACWREGEPAAQAAMVAAVGLDPTPLAAPLLLCAALQVPDVATRDVVLAGLRGLATLAHRHPAAGDADGGWISPRERLRLRSLLWQADAAIATAAADLVVALAGRGAREASADAQTLLDVGIRHIGLGIDAVLERGWARFPWTGARLRTVAAALERGAVGEDASVRAAALFAFTAVQPDAAFRMLRQSLQARDWRQRACAVRALAALPAGRDEFELWARAAADRSAPVRTTLATALLDAKRRGAGDTLARLEQFAPAVAELLATHIPNEVAFLQVERLVGGLPRVDVDDTILRVALVRAIAALGERESSAAADLALLRADPDPAVRRTAQELAGERPEPWPDARTFRLGIDLPWSTYARAPRIAITTSAGVFTLELDAAAAPVHVHRLLERVRTGRFGAGVRRHTSTAVVFGDQAQVQPRVEDLLRREVSPARLSHSGIVVFAPSVVPDCDGPDLFVTLVPRPELQGTVTVVGRVCDGMDVVERLRAGDRFLDIALVPGSD